MRSATIVALVILARPVAADEPMNLDQLMQAFGWNFEQTEINAQKLGDGLHLLFGVGGNVAVSLGEDGVFIVDDQFPQMMPKIKAKIAELGGGAIDFAVNTHWHFDHAEGNLALGPEGTWLVAQSRSRAMMDADHVINGVVFSYLQKAYPEEARPVITFDERMQFHFNGERIDLAHYGPAHTTGDTAVFFRGHNAVHLGDVFNTAGYPFIDVDNGGDLQGVIAFCSAVLAESNEETKVIPGHGAVSDYTGLKNYIAMLSTIQERVAKLIAGGAKLDAVVAAKPTAEFDAAFGDPAAFLNRAYASLTRPAR
jgi:glyoxylase-like metal-dependent hydrolase (beta-lactamase superfamily II)